MRQKKAATLEELLSIIVATLFNPQLQGGGVTLRESDRERIVRDLERVATLRFLKICHDRQFDDENLHALAETLKEHQDGDHAVNLLDFVRREGFSELLAEAVSETLHSWTSDIGVDMFPESQKKISEVLKTIAAP